MVTSRNDSLSANYRQQLVTTLQKKGAIRRTSLAQAFARIPREEFVSCFYDRPPGQRTWEMYTPECMELADWLAVVYQDRSLITRITHDTPTSSSSMPSVMAQMLEALDPQVGQRVLEIGTGTGYNAAILAELVEDPTLVTTVDIDGDLVDRARQLLHQTVGQVYVYARDGSLGESAHAPYDRIIVTASVSSLPRQWYKQLAPGGRLVVALQGALGESGFLVVEKASNGQSASGQFLAPRLHFMSLRIPEASPLTSARELFQQPAEWEVQIGTEHRFLMLLQNPAFRWFAQWWWPGTITINQATMPDKARIIILMDQGNQTILQLKQYDNGWWRGKQHGGFSLWETIEQAIEQFLVLGEPERGLYRVQMNEQEAMLQVCDASKQAHSIRDLYPPQ